MGGACPGSIVNMTNFELKVVVEKRAGDNFVTLQTFRVDSKDTRQFKNIPKYVRITITTEEQTIQKQAVFYTWYGYSWKVTSDDNVTRMEEGGKPATGVEEDNVLYEKRNEYSQHKLKVVARRYFEKSTEVNESPTSTTLYEQVTHRHRELNILLLGQSGVGKSTWINGIANYLNYNTIQEAEENGLKILIPIKFSTTDDDMQTVFISIGSSDNEAREDGQAATQRPQTYTFEMKETTVRIIDTPGIGDPRGTEQDKTNFQNILDYIAEFDILNAICILLKPNEERLSVLLQYCLLELFSKLHRDACRNVVFCYTNSRSTFYAPGSTNTILKNLLQQYKINELLTMIADKKVVLHESIIYNVDNECIKYLAAKQKGTVLAGGSIVQFRQSWNKSVIESERLMKHIERNKPHPVKNTLSINNARRMILLLTRPLAEISYAIEENIVATKEAKKSMKKKNVSLLTIPSFVLTAIALDGIYQVCTTVHCLKYSAANSPSKVLEYKCKVRCTPSDGLTPRPCSKCPCNADHHQLISYEIQRTITHNNVTSQTPSTSVAQKRQQLTDYLRTLENLETELKLEKKQILMHSAQFARFLKDNMIVPHNDSMNAYIDHQIESKLGDSTAVERLRTIRREYAEEVRILEAEINKARGRVTQLKPDEVKRKIEEIYTLKHSGPILSKIITVVEAAHSNALAYMEIVVNPSARSSEKCSIM